MPDTYRGDFKDAVCSDCGKTGCLFIHFGPLSPNGKTLHLCGGCWTDRAAFYEKEGYAKPVKEKEPS